MNKGKGFNGNSEEFEMPNRKLPGSESVESSPSRGGGAHIRALHTAQVLLPRWQRLHLEVLKLCFRVLCLHGGSHDDALAIFPIHGSRETIVGSELQRSDHAEDLFEVAA